MEMIKIQIALINSDHYWIKKFNQLHSSNWYFDSFTPFRSVWQSFLLIQCLQFAKIKIAAEDFVDNLETAAEALNATNLGKYSSLYLFSIPELWPYLRFLAWILKLFLSFNSSSCLWLMSINSFSLVVDSSWCQPK